MKTKVTLGKGLSIETNKKTDYINYKKLVANTDGHFEVEAELNDAIADCTIGMSAKIGSAKWQAKNGEELVLNVEYGNSDLNFTMDTDLLKAGSMTTDMSLSYAYGDFLVGGSCGLGLPFALINPAAKFSVNESALGVKYKSGDLCVGAGFSGVHSGFRSANMDINIHHKASNDTKWGATISSKSTWRPSDMSAKLAMETKLDGATTFSFNVNQDGQCNAKFAQEVSSKMKMTYQCKIDANDIAKDQAFGMGIEISA